MKTLASSLCLVFAVACETGSTKHAPETLTRSLPVPAATNKNRLGTPIAEGLATVALTDLAKGPAAFKGKEFVTTGTVEKVCQHRGCWMTLKDDRGEAYVRMSGHSFFIPKDASGKKARVFGRIVDADGPEETSCNGEHKAGCKAEAEKQNGAPLARLELDAKGVELY